MLGRRESPDAKDGIVAINLLKYNVVRPVREGTNDGIRLAIQNTRWPLGITHQVTGSFDSSSSK